MSDHDLAVRVDVIDLIISVLREHEKALSKSIERLEAVLERLNEERRKRT